MIREDKNKAILECGDDYDEILDIQYGQPGTPTREQFENDAEAFILAERLKEERKKAGLTQEQLAEKIGTKKSYISRLENGKADVQLSTLYKIFRGLGKRVSVTIL
jgi:DNA-binding XRE family transcriptional regulator